MHTNISYNQEPKVRLSGYSFKLYSNSYKKGCILKTYRFVFKNKDGLKYTIQADKFKYDLFIIKFFLTKQKSSSLRFNKLVKCNDARRIIYTCIQAAETIYQKYPNASFGFIGAPTEPELAKKNPYNNTKRHRVYRYYSSFFLSDEKFKHLSDNQKSTYILLNKSQLISTPDLLDKIYNNMMENFTEEQIYHNPLGSPN